MTNIGNVITGVLTLLAIAGGVAAGVMYEHCAPWALGHQLATAQMLKASADANTAAQTAIAVKCTSDSEMLRQQASRAGNDAAAAISQQSAQCTADTTHAYNAGVIAGKQIERTAQHGQTASSSSSSGAVPAVGGVPDDFAQFWSGTSASASR